MLAYLSNVCNCVNYSERKDYICNVKFTSPEGGGGGAGGRLKLPNLGRNLFHSGKLSERTIGNSSRKFTERLQSPPKFDVLLRPWLSYCRIH